MEYNLQPLNKSNLEILRNLFQLYIHDISSELAWDCNDKGLFEAYSLGDWLQNESNFGYLVYVAGKLAGFVMVDKEFKVLSNQPNNYNLAEIFILNGYKGNHLASSVVNQVFDMYRGNWECRPVPNSVSALTFWGKVFAEFPQEVKKIEWKKDRFAFIFSNI